MSVLRTVAPGLLGATLLLGAAGSPSTALARGSAQSGISLDHAKVVAAEPVYRTVSHSVPVEHCTLVEEPIAAERQGPHGAAHISHHWRCQRSS